MRARKATIFMSQNKRVSDQKDNQMRHSRIALLAILFLDNLALAIVYPLFTPLILKPIHALLPTHFSLSTRFLLLGLLISSFPLAQFLGGPFIGHLAATKTRKKAFLIALIGEFTGFFLSAVALTRLSYVLLLFKRCTLVRACV